MPSSAPSRAGAGSRLARWRAGAPSRFRRRPHREVVVLVAGLAVVGGCIVVAGNGEVAPAEEAVFSAINGLPDALQAPLWTSQLLGALATVAVAAATALILGRSRLGLALLAAIPMKLALEWWVVKATVQRERPAFTVPGAIVREVNTARLGFPSGHAVFAFALAGLIAPYLSRRGAMIVYGLAALNGLARVYLGAHNLLDVVAGAGLGIAIAAGLNLAAGVPHAPE